MYWAVCQTESQREQVAAEFLKQASYEVYLPKILVKRNREAPLFPGYLFVRIIEQWWVVRWSVGVVRLLMSDNLPAQVPEKVVNGIRRREGSDGLVKLPKARGLMRGDAVRIVRGSFSGHLGLYEGMDGSARVCVLLEMMGARVPVTLGRGDIETVRVDAAT